MRLAVNDYVYLSTPVAADQDALVAHLNDPEIYDRTLHIPYPYREEDAVEFISRVLKVNQEQGRPLCWAIREDQGHMIGCFWFEGLVLGRSHRAEIGYWLARPYWGRGIMTAAVRTACGFAFREFGLVKVTAHVFAHNEASARVLEKCGFLAEGYLRKHFRKDGQFFDAKVYGLLA